MVARVDIVFFDLDLQVDDKTIVMVVDPGDDDRKSGGGEKADRVPVCGMSWAGADGPVIG